MRTTMDDTGRCCVPQPGVMQKTLLAVRNVMSVGKQTVSDASPQRGEVGRGAHCGRRTPRLLARLGFLPPPSPRWAYKGRFLEK